MNPCRIALVGTGWRTAPYLRVARDLPGEFEVVAALTRSESSVARMQAAGIPATTSLDELLRRGPFDFALVSVPRDQALPLSGALIDAGVPVLCETPLAPTTGDLTPFLDRYGLHAPLQVAEQYRLQPMHAARIAVARSGRLGRAHSVSLSVAHQYHAMSLLRALLSLGFERADVTAQPIEDVVVPTLGRAGWASTVEEQRYPRLTAQLRFPDRDAFAVDDWQGEQYFSPIRSRHLTVRGTHGELADDVVRWMQAPGDPVEARITRRSTGVDGDLEGYHLARVQLGAETLWSDPFGGMRWADDEIAVGGVLRGMADFVARGTPFYGIADAAEDQYLAELVGEAAASGGIVSSGPRAWQSARSVLA